MKKYIISSVFVLGLILAGSGVASAQNVLPMPFPTQGVYGGVGQGTSVSGGVGQGTSVSGPGSYSSTQAVETNQPNRVIAETIEIGAEGDVGIETVGAGKFKSKTSLETALKMQLERCMRLPTDREKSECKIRATKNFEIRGIIKAVRDIKVKIGEKDDKNVGVRSDDDDSDDDDRDSKTKRDDDVSRKNISQDREKAEKRLDDLVKQKLDHFRRLLDRFNAYHIRLSKIGDLIETRIEKFDSDSNDANNSEARRHLGLARTHLKDARASIDVARKLWQEVTNTSVTDPATIVSVNSDTAIIVNDFDSCVKAGSPAMESNPPKCQFNGKVYTANETTIKVGVEKKSIKDIYAPVIEALEKAKKSLGAAKSELLEALRSMRQGPNNAAAEVNSTTNAEVKVVEPATN